MTSNILYNDVLSKTFAAAEKLLVSQVEDVIDTRQSMKDSAILYIVLGESSVETIIAFMSQSPLNHPLKTLKDKEVVPLGKTIAEGLSTLINNLSQNKYLYSILMTCLVEKLVHPNQDIRYAQSELPKGYSNRSKDQLHVTPFLKRHNLTSCAASGAESGRNFERPYPYELNYVCKPRGQGNREAFLGILHAIEEEGVDPFPCLVLLMALDLQKKDIGTFKYPQPEGATIQDIVDAVLSHLEQAKGNGRARLPVLAIQAIYQCLIPELIRYKETSLRNPPNRHTGNDKEGWIGDVQVDRADGSPFEAVEVKSGRRINSDMVRALPRKLSGQVVDRYYILSTEEQYSESNQQEEIREVVKVVRLQTGCQVIVNGLNKSLWYYLRLISEPEKFLKYYTEQIQTDKDVKDEHRILWSRILQQLEETSV